MPLKKLYKATLLIQALVKETLDAGRGSFYVIDKDKNDELSADVYEEGLDEYNFQLIKKNLKVNPLRRERGIVSMAAKSGYIVNVKDPSKDPRIGKEPEMKIGKAIRSLLCVPISSSEGLVGE